MNTWSLHSKLNLFLTFGAALILIVGTDRTVSQNTILQTDQAFVNAEMPDLTHASEMRLRGREPLGLFLQINSPKKDEIEISIMPSQQSDFVPTNHTKLNPKFGPTQKRVS